MSKRVWFVVTVAVLAVVTSCSRVGDDDAAPTSTAPNATVESTTVITSGTTQTTSDDPTPSTTEAIPPLTPPASQPVACSLLSPGALQAVGVPPDTPTAPDDRPNGVPAPSNGCEWQSDPGVSLVLYYGIDPLEILAVVRQTQPGGTDVTGIGQDAYYVTGILFVDTGSQAFSLTGGPTSEQLQTLAEDVLANL